jgi:hypothetical protein
MTSKGTCIHWLKNSPSPSSWLPRAFWHICGIWPTRCAARRCSSPWDDEPEAEEERQEAQEAREELSRGETIANADLWRRLGYELRRCVDTGGCIEIAPGHRLTEIVRHNPLPSAQPPEKVISPAAG